MMALQLMRYSFLLASALYLMTHTVMIELTKPERLKIMTIPFDYHCEFAKDGWSNKEWMLAKSPRWDYFGSWIQEADHIQNAIPVGASAKEMEEDSILGTADLHQYAVDT